MLDDRHRRKSRVYGVHVGAVSRSHRGSKTVIIKAFDILGITEVGSRRTFTIWVMLEASSSMAFVSQVLQESTNHTTSTKVRIIRVVLLEFGSDRMIPQTQVTLNAYPTTDPPSDQLITRENTTSIDCLTSRQELLPMRIRIRSISS